MFSTTRPGRALSVTLLAASAALATLLESLPAFAQYTTPVTTRRPAASSGTPEQSARDASVLRRPRAEAPEGFAVGTFILSPMLEVAGEYDDNVFRTKHNKQDDFIFHLRPGLSLQSDWGQHALGFYASADIARYADFTSEDYEAFTVGTNGRLDITDELALVANGEFARTAILPGAPGFTGGVPSNALQIVNVITGGFQLVYTNDPWYGRVGPRFRRFDYIKGVVGDPDYNVYDISGRIGYRFTPDLSVFLDPSYEWVRYDNDIPGNDNNQGFDIRLGVAYDVSQDITAELGAGYYRRWFTRSGVKPEDGFSFLGRLFWNPTDVISVEAEARRGFTQYRSNISNSAAVGNAIETYVGVRVGWAPIDPILLDAGAAYSQYNYQGQGQRDDYLYFDAGVRYFFNANFYAGPRYYFERRTGKPSSLNYTDNRFLLTLGAQL
jgi:hypothetical protein